MTREQYIEELKINCNSQPDIDILLRGWDAVYNDIVKTRGKEEADRVVSELCGIPRIVGDEPPGYVPPRERKPVDGNDMLEKILEGTYDLNVGLFWISNDNVQIEYSELISRHSAIYEVNSNEIFINPQKDHIDTWYKTYTQNSKIIQERIIKKYEAVPYNYYPRGRVTYYVNKKKMESYYLVLIDKCFVRNKAMQKKVIAAFGLSGKVKFDTDSHYICNGCK